MYTSENYTHNSVREKELTLFLIRTHTCCTSTATPIA